MKFVKSQRAVENRRKWRKLVVKSSVVLQRYTRLRDRWSWRKMDLHTNIIDTRKRFPPTVVDRPVETGKSGAELWTQTKWEDSADWQAVNSRQRERWTERALRDLRLLFGLYKSLSLAAGCLSAHRFRIAFRTSRKPLFVYNNYLFGCLLTERSQI